MAARAERRPYGNLFPARGRAREKHVGDVGGSYKQNEKHCAEKHLQRYLTEFDFRYNRRRVTDLVRAHEAMSGIGGKRLFYKAPVVS